MNKNTKQSIWSVSAGILVVITVTTIVDVVLHWAGVFPPLDVPIDNRLSLIATSYRVVIGIAGAWVTARLAPAGPMKHVMILGVIGTVLGGLGVVATLSQAGSGRALGPLWYPIALAVLAIPQSWIGGKIFLKRFKASRAAHPLL